MVPASNRQGNPLYSTQASTAESDAAGRESHEQATEPPVGKAERIRSKLPHVALAIELLVAAGYLVGESRRLWFFLDDWSFLLNRRLTTDGLHNVFYPHNEHWSTLPILVFRALFTLFGVRHYLPYALVVIALHVGVCILLWLLLQAVSTNQWISVGLVGIMAFLGAGAENTLWAFQIGFVGSTLFGLLSLLLILRSAKLTSRNAWSKWACLIASLMCSGIGVPMVIAAGVLAFIRWSWRAALQVASVPIAVFIAWYLVIGQQGTAHDNTSISGYLQVPEYVWTGITNALTKMSAIPGSGAILLLLLVIPLLVTSIKERAAQLAMAGLAGVFSLYLFTGLTRVRFGVNQATASRYVYVAAALLLPLVAWSIQRLHRQRLAATIAFWAVTILAIANGVWLTHSFASTRAAVLAGQQEQIVAAEQIVKSGQRTLSELVDPAYAPDITVQKLKRSDVRTAFPSVKPDPQGLIDAQSYIQVGVAKAPYGQIPPPSSLNWSGVTGPPIDAGCTSGQIVSPHAYLDAHLTGRGGMVELISSGSVLRTQLVHDDLTGPVVGWPVTAEQKSYIASVAPEGTLRTFLPAAGVVTVCTPL